MLNISPFITVYSCIVLGLLGACLASFICCVADRKLEGESAFKGRSHCNSCGRQLDILDLIPVVGYLISKGKCRQCSAKIPARYPIFEALLAIAYVLAFLRFDVSIEYIYDLIFITSLFTAAYADLISYEIPTSSYVVPIVAFVLIKPFIELSDINDLPLVLDMVYGDGLLGGIVIAGAIFVISLLLDKTMKKESLGGGDIKLIFVAGLYLGLIANLFNMILICIIGLVFAMISKKRRDTAYIPLAPAIAIASFIMLLYGQGFVDFYISLLLG